MREELRNEHLPGRSSNLNSQKAKTPGYQNESYLIQGYFIIKPYYLQYFQKIESSNNPCIRINNVTVPGRSKINYCMKIRTVKTSEMGDQKTSPIIRFISYEKQSSTRWDGIAENWRSNQTTVNGLRANWPYLLVKYGLKISPRVCSWKKPTGQIIT